MISQRYRTLKAAIEKRHSAGKIATIPQIKKLIDLGQCDEAYHYIRRYGMITHDNSYERKEDSPTGFYKAGHCRDLTIEYEGQNFGFELFNGEVYRIEWSEKT